MKRKYAAAVLLAFAVLIILGVRGWGDLAALPVAAGGCLLALIPPARGSGPPSRGRAPGATGRMVASPAILPGRGSMLLDDDLAAGLPREAWLCHDADADTLGLPPDGTLLLGVAMTVTPPHGRPRFWDEGGAASAARPLDSHPYPIPPGVSPAGFLAGLASVLEDVTTTAAPPGPDDEQAWEDDEPWGVVETRRIPEGWVIWQPGTRTPPRVVRELPAPPAPAEAQWPVRADFEREQATWAAPGLLPGPGPRHAAFALAPKFPVELGPAWPEALERRADTGEISAVIADADLARELAEQDRDARDYLNMLERETYSTATAFARQLEAERAQWSSGR